MPDDELSRGLNALSAFFVGGATMGETLHRVAEMAVQAIASADFVGITMMVRDAPGTAVFTDRESPEIDQAQYDSGRGPCLESFRTGQRLEVPSTADDTRWPEFSQACLKHGIHSTLSLPLTVDDLRLGALNIYSSIVNAFTPAETANAEQYATQASIVLGNAQAYTNALALSDQLSESMKSRAVIEQAKGIIMASMRCTADQAFEQLVKQSQATNTKLHEIAKRIVDDTTRRRA